MNWHYAFWKSYYDDIRRDDRGEFINPNLESKNKLFTEQKWRPGSQRIPQQDQAFTMKTEYPGLLSGVGLTHDSGSKQDKSNKDKSIYSEVQIGFLFDQVTGLPFIPGSSVKGMLRSAFLDMPELVFECLQKRLTDLTGDYGENRANLNRLEIETFGKTHPEHHAYDVIDFPEGIGQDCFLDAWPVCADKDGHLIGMDSVTPHLAENPDLQGLTGPNPNTFLKVLPEVVYQFRFILRDSTAWPEVTAGVKRRLFHDLIETLGIGAKTDTGYGILTSVPTEGWETAQQDYRFLVPSAGSAPVPVEPRVQQLQSRPTQPRQPVRPAARNPQPSPQGAPGVGDRIRGRITRVMPYGVFVDLGGGRSGLIHIKEWANHFTSQDDLRQEAIPGKEIEVVVIASQTPGKISLSRKQLL